jgi:hypothetical protein
MIAICLGGFMTHHIATFFVIMMSCLQACMSASSNDSEAKDLVIRNGTAYTGTFVVPTVKGQEVGKRDFCIYESIWNQEPQQEPAVASIKLLHDRQFNESQVIQWFNEQKEDIALGKKTDSQPAILAGLFGLGCFFGAPACIGGISIGGLVALATLNRATANEQRAKFDSQQYQDQIGADNLTNVRKYQDFDQYRAAKDMLVYFVTKKLNTRSNGKCSEKPENLAEFQKSLDAAARKMRN